MGTHTIATMNLSAEAYEEIREQLEAAGYDHAFLDDGTLDMSGIGVVSDGDTVDKLIEVYSRAASTLPGGSKLMELSKTPRVDTNRENTAYLAGWRDCIRSVAVALGCYTEFCQKLDDVREVPDNG